MYVHSIFCEHWDILRRKKKTSGSCSSDVFREKCVNNIFPDGGQSQPRWSKVGPVIQSSPCLRYWSRMLRTMSASTLASLLATGSVSDSLRAVFTFLCFYFGLLHWHWVWLWSHANVWYRPHSSALTIIFCFRLQHAFSSECYTVVLKIIHTLVDSWYISFLWWNENTCQVCLRFMIGQLLNR